MNEPTAGDDLLWIACRYELNELSPAEMESFEERLAGDQSAREALAEAVRLHGLVSACLAEPATCSSVAAEIMPASQAGLAEVAAREQIARPAMQSGAGWAQAGWWAFAAACLVLGFVVSRPAALQQPTGPSNEQTAARSSAPTAPTPTTLGDEQLLAALVSPAPGDTDVADEWGLIATVVPPAAEDSQVGADPDEDEVATDDPMTSADEPTAPDWLIAAVAESNGN